MLDFNQFFRYDNDGVCYNNVIKCSRQLSKLAARCLVGFVERSMERVIIN